MQHVPWLVVAIVAASTSFASANDRDDFADDLKDYTGAYYSHYIIDHLTTFKLGDKCWAKMHDKDENGIHTASFWIGYVHELAKRVTKDDWSAIETQGNSDREKNKPVVEAMIKDFAKKKLSFTLVAEGDDCDTTSGSLMLRYWTTVGDSLQYLSGKSKVTIKLTVTAKTKDVTVKVTKSAIEITGSRDIEPAEWSEKIAKAFRRSKL